ncbi:hypothetical protein, partial [Leptospira alstonii]|uniref:hypothetical protein n=1 Tax=Leptospira alstonii TaxID=28452 RepID=UPI001F48C702
LFKITPRNRFYFPFPSVMLVRRSAILIFARLTNLYNPFYKCHTTSNKLKLGLSSSPNLYPLEKSTPQRVLIPKRTFPDDKSHHLLHVHMLEIEAMKE